MIGEAPGPLDRTLARLEHFGVKLGLERMHRVLAELGSTAGELPTVLVSGTNGKGSTCAWLASIVSAAGYRSGLFTSPHLERVEERLRVDGRAVSTERLESLIFRVVAASERAEGELVTYFEAMTAAALVLFREASVDLAVMEVGLGGRLDATNVTSPMLSLVTQIGFDHQRQLGETLAEIAAEKAGILRPGRPALASTSHSEARAALERVAKELGSDLCFVGDRVRVEQRTELVGGGQQVVLSTNRHCYRLESRSSGAHQVENLALAVLAAERLAGMGLPRIDRRAIESGVASCHWPGRLEFVHLATAGRVLLDAAHNPAGLEALRGYLEVLDRPFVLVFGMLREKVDPEVVARLWAMADRTIVTRPDSPRALAPQEVVSIVGTAPGSIVAEPGAALEVALEHGLLVVVCGSLYLVGELRTWLRRTFGVPPFAERLFV